MLSPNPGGSIADLHTQDGAGAVSLQGIAQLLDNRPAFLRYVERRVGNPALAEELVQDALVRSLKLQGEVRDSVVGWFYRVLRNAIVDYRRSLAVADRNLEAFASVLEVAASADEERAGEVCTCVNQLTHTLKPEYAEVLQRVELDELSVKDYAAVAGISASNAGVRLFRAREALRRQVARACGGCAESGCLACTCGTPRT